MKVSILTVCYNSEKTILDTLNSVLNQTYKNIEHIIIDGESTDKTKYFLQKYSFKNRKIFYIKKSGVYNALNYGIKKATGDVLHILHADDIYQSSDTLSNIIKIIKKRKEDFFTSDVAFFDKNKYSTISRFYSAKNFNISKMYLGLMPPHTGCFIKKNVYKNFLYDESYKIAGDFDLIARILIKNKINFFYINTTSVRMRTGGLSTKNFFSHLISTLEISKSFKNNNLSSNFLYALMRFPLKVPQLFFIKKDINRDFNLKLSEFYKSFSRYNFIIKNKLDYLDYNKNFIYSAMNLSFLGSYANNEIENNKYSIFWSDGIFTNSIIDANLKIPGRKILKLLKLPINIKKITVIGNLSNNGRSYLKKLYKKYINHRKLPYGSIQDILKKFNYKSSKNELIFTTLPSPKQEILANYISKNNQHFKIVCIGGAISMACGDEKEVPKILYKYEFLWRLQFESKRRIKRLLHTFFSYLYGKYIGKRFDNLKVIYEI